MPAAHAGDAAGTPGHGPRAPAAARGGRRSFLATGLGAAALLTLGGCAGLRVAAERAGPPRALPRWRGFNLLEKLESSESGPYREQDFDLAAEWGFDFMRLPVDYRAWTVAPGEYREDMLREIDEAVAWGRARGIHVSLSLHRAPGYCVNPPAEPLDLWADGATGPEARRQFAEQWAMLAVRYRGVASADLSFDLLNEPGAIAVAPYVRAVALAVDAIRAVDDGRLVIADGLRWGTEPVAELVPLGVAQSTRGYTPMRISHHRAPWIPGSDSWPAPTWPLAADGGWDRDRLRRETIAPWLALQARHVGVHVGEWGAYHRTPHAVALAWMRDQLGLWRAAGWGWALWNLRGPFGVLDSERTDLAYESYRGHRLDRAMVELLREG